MKEYNKILFIITLLAANALTADATASNKRCGLGSKIFGSSKATLSQLGETFTNISASGSASIAYGTSGCKHNGLLIYDSIGKNDRLEEQIQYANANFEELLFEMASGSGQTLTSFAETFGCSGRAAESFSEMTRRNYPQIIDNEQVSPDLMVQRVRTNFIKNNALRMLCGSV
jgi:hypothetical protein